MTRVQLSVEEYLNKFSFNDSNIEQLLVLNPTTSDQIVGSLADNTCSPYDGVDFIGKTENKFDSFDLLVISRSTKL
jgi:hypothetical protein